MKSITIQGQKRESVGKNATKALRNAEKVPCVVYGESEPVHFSSLEKSFKDLVYTPSAHTVELQIDNDKPVMAILKDIQYHPITDKILHADFYRLNADKPVSMQVPVSLTGRSRGVMNGGSLRFTMRKLMVKAIPEALPDEVVIDITSLRIGQKITIAQLKNDKYSIMHPDSSVVVAVKTARNATMDVEEEEEEEGEVEGAEVNTEANESENKD